MGQSERWAVVEREHVLATWLHSKEYPSLVSVLDEVLTTWAEVKWCRPPDERMGIESSLGSCMFFFLEYPSCLRGFRTTRLNQIQPRYSTPLKRRKLSGVEHGDEQKSGGNQGGSGLGEV